MKSMLIKDKIVQFTIKKELDISFFCREIFKNLPEYSLSLECFKYDYNEMEFTFCDHTEEGDIDYILTREKIEKGMEIFIQNCLDGKYENSNLKDPQYLFEIGNWDADMVDMAIQICIFNEIVYG